MEKECKCGRSPIDKCIGWHNLTNEQYDLAKAEHDRVKAEYEKRLLEESAPQLLKD